jgi:hypothetical protein
MKQPQNIFAHRMVIPAASLLMVLLVAGCGSKSSETDLALAPVKPAVSLQADVGAVAPAAAPPPASGNAVAPTAPSGKQDSPFSQPDQGANDAAMAKLNEGLRKFFAHYQRAPYTVDELISEKFVEAIPQAPAGKEYFYDSVGLKFKLINQRAK